MQLNKCHVGNIYLTVAVRVTKQDIIFTYCFRKYVGVVLASIVGIDCQRFSIAKRDGIGVSGFERDAVPAEIKAPDLGVFVQGHSAAPQDVGFSGFVIDLTGQCAVTSVGALIGADAENICSGLFLVLAEPLVFVHRLGIEGFHCEDFRENGGVFLFAVIICDGEVLGLNDPVVRENNGV